MSQSITLSIFNTVNFDIISAASEKLVRDYCYVSLEYVKIDVMANKISRVIIDCLEEHENDFEDEDLITLNTFDECEFAFVLSHDVQTILMGLNPKHISDDESGLGYKHGDLDIKIEREISKILVRVYNYHNRD